MVIVLVYCPSNAMRRKEQRRELARVVSNFHGSLLLIWGDFNVILEGGTDLMTLE